VTATLAIARREMLAFFVSPIAYVVLTVWLLFYGIMLFVLAMSFSMQPTGAASNFLEAFFGGTALFWLPLLVFAPVLTMRLLAEERASGNIEPLLTAPVSEVEIVLGKYLAAMTFWVVLWLPTLSYVWLASETGKDVVDYGAIGATYLGLFCMGAFYMAVGLFMSAVARNQIVAAVLTFAVIGLTFLAGVVSLFALDDQWRGFFEYIGLWTQMGAFSKGIVDTRFLVYDLSVAGMALYLSVRVLQANRW
jgi:ABC-2 type transport system permease protein